MRDPYDVLGVRRTASDEDIKSAYRRLAKRWHPDANADDPAAAQRFQDVTSAYTLLRDKEKRAAFDRGEIDATGKKRFHRGFQDMADAYAAKKARERAAAGGMGADGSAKTANRSNGAAGRGQESGGAAETGFKRSFAEDGPEAEERRRQEGIFSDLFGSMRDGVRSGARAFGIRGADVTYRLTVPFAEAARGTVRRVKLPTERKLDVRVPAGIKDGQQIRLKGQGEAGHNGGEAGDALVTVEVEPHKFFRRDGLDIHLDLPVTVDEAVLGAKITVPTLEGPVTMTVPEGSNTGSVFRLRGRGILPSGADAAGDQYVTLKVVLPEGEHGQFAKLVRKWAQKNRYDVRAGLE